MGKRLFYSVYTYVYTRLLAQTKKHQNIVQCFDRLGLSPWPFRLSPLIRFGIHPLPVAFFRSQASGNAIAHHKMIPPVKFMALQMCHFVITASIVSRSSCILKAGFDIDPGRNDCTTNSALTVKQRYRVALAGSVLPRPNAYEVITSALYLHLPAICT
jgi:hypothetical protein